MTSQRAQASDSTSNNVENDVESQGNNVEKSLGVPKELVKLRNSDTKSKSIEEMLPSTCWICHQALPLDNAYCTTLEGQTVHEACYRKLKAQEKKKCKNLTTLENRPFCSWLQSFLANTKQCTSECDGYEETPENE